MARREAPPPSADGRDGRDGRDGVGQPLRNVVISKRVVAPPLLTARQAEILHACVAAGYYAIPRKATLRQLAKRLGISATSLSLILRRAEAKVVLAFLGQLDGKA